MLCILVGDIITSNGDMNKEREEKLLKNAFAYCGSRKDANCKLLHIVEIRVLL